MSDDGLAGPAIAEPTPDVSAAQVAEALDPPLASSTTRDATAAAIPPVISAGQFGEDALPAEGQAEVAEVPEAGSGAPLENVAEGLLEEEDPDFEGMLTIPGESAQVLNPAPMAGFAKAYSQRLMSPLPGESEDFSGGLGRFARCTAADPFWVYSAAPQEPAKRQELNFPRVPMPMHCLQDAAAAIEYVAEIEVPEQELMTVQLRTREQRLDWRDFLCEAVAGRKAAGLYQLYDSEADPPPYLKPPPSSVGPESADRWYQHSKEVTPLLCVAPDGAGMVRSSSSRIVCVPVSPCDHESDPEGFAQIPTEDDHQLVPESTEQSDASASRPLGEAAQHERTLSERSGRSGRSGLRRADGVEDGTRVNGGASSSHDEFRDAPPSQAPNVLLEGV